MSPSIFFPCGVAVDGRVAGNGREGGEGRQDEDERSALSLFLISTRLLL